MKLGGKRVTVMGLGRLGGGVGVARFLLEQGAAVTVTDQAAADKLAGSIASVGPAATYHLGGHTPEDFTDTDLVIANPAVKPDSEWLRRAAERGVPIETEMNLFFERCPARIVGITGSVGKTTTTAMIEHALTAPEVLRDSRHAEGQVWVGGNIGRSLLLDLGRMGRDNLVVLELSSAMLHWLRPTGLAPQVAVVTNITENHVDWHGSFENYIAAKKNVVANQSAGNVAVLNGDDEELLRWAGDCKGTVLWTSTDRSSTQRHDETRRHEGGKTAEGVFLRDGRLVARVGGRETVVLDAGKMRLPGAHNAANAAAAVAACAAVGADLGAVGEALVRFSAVEHRLEFTREVKGVRYYNDSKATTPLSSLAALRSFDAPTVIILGGRDKHMVYDELIDELGRAAQSGRCRSVILMGEMAELLDAKIARRASHVPRVRAGSFEEAVRNAADAARPGDVVVLSPACTSYDMFQNFEERGQAFKRVVAQMAG